MAEGLCPYCGNVRELTDEHVLPRSIGGNLIGSPTASGVSSVNPFKLGVCRRCNSLCGTWVDGMFTRSWMLHSARFSTAIHHIDLENGVTPLCFMGRTEFRTPELESDFWLGPTGDALYHLHEPYPRDYATIGIPHWIDRDKLDRGIVLVYVRASNPEWHPMIARSIASQFEGAQIFFLNASVTDSQTGERRTGTLPEKYEALARTIHTRVYGDGHRAHDVEHARDENCGDRFLVKLALGFGALFLDESFRRSADGDLLRSFLWNKDRDSWPEGLSGSTFFDEVDPTLVRLTNWRGCHLLMLHEHESGVALTVNLYGKYYAGLRVATSDFGFERLGSPQVIWLVAPGLRLFTGPMSLDDYTNAYLHPRPSDRLAHLRAALDAAPSLPPFDLPPGLGTPLVKLGLR